MLGLDAAEASKSVSVGWGAVPGLFSVTLGIGGGFGEGAVVGSAKKVSTSSIVGSPAGDATLFPSALPV